MDLREFLVAAELDAYYDQLHDGLRVASVAHIKYVDDNDLLGIGMSKPEIRRLRQFHKKAFPRGALSKLKKKVWGKNESGVSQHHETAAEKPGSSSSKPANRHLIAEHAISIQKTIGNGEFGIVQEAIWTNDHGERLPVAVKCLAKDKLKTQMAEFLLEAANMCSVDHPHIVQLYGVVLSSDCLMLVTELAPMRTLLDCLQDSLLGHTFGVSLLCDLALQIANGMAYLEKRRLIHRDLAARNILVFAKDKIKVSDFGLSRALGVEKDYYQSQPNSSLVLPIAWCAPECVNYLKFTSASDVWSFGVTLWEMFTRGQQPWEGMTGLEIMQAVDEPDYQRLPQPERCPDDWYQLMLHCWAAEPNDRPKFSELFLISITQIKPVRVIASRDVSAENSDLVLELKTNDVIVVLSKTASPYDHLDVANMWKGVVERTQRIGYFDRANTTPYFEIPSIDTSVLRSKTVRAAESSRFSLRPTKKLHAGLIGLPQNDLRHIGHVGYDGAVFGDVSFIGDNYSKLPIKVSGAQASQGGEILAKTTNGSAPLRSKTFSGSDRMAVSASSIETTMTKHNDDFDDFQLPDLSISFDFGSSLMDEVMKSLGSSASDSSDGAKPSTSAMEISPRQQVRSAQQAAETNGQAQVARMQVVADTAASPDAESESDTESDGSDETSSSDSTVSANDIDSPAANAADRNTQAASSSPPGGKLVTAVVMSDFVPKAVPRSAMVTTELDEYSSSSKQHLCSDITSSSGVQGLESESLWLRRTYTDDVDSGSSCVDKNGFSSDATAAYDELVGNKRRSLESSGDHSTGQVSATRKTSLEFSASSSTELKVSGNAGLRSQRSTNQNIRMPQGIPGRDSVTRKPFINPLSSSAAPAATADESDFDTNPLRRLRDSQSGFTKPVFRPTSTSAVAPRSAEPLLPSSNNLNVNLTFFDKLKEQEQLRKV